MDQMKLGQDLLETHLFFVMLKIKTSPIASTIKMGEDAFVNFAIKIFRDFHPNLYLPQRSKMLLSHLKDKYPLFLITDGSSTLQRKKFLSLGLSEYFAENNVVFTGDYRRESSYFKP